MENKRLLSRLRGWFQPGAGVAATETIDKPVSGKPASGKLASGESDGGSSGGGMFGSSIPGVGKSDDHSGDKWSGVSTATQAARQDQSASVSTRSQLKPTETRLEKLQEGYLQVIELVDNIRKHQDRQDQRAVEFSTSLSQMATSLVEIEKGNRLQVDRLANIADELKVGNERGNHWQEVLAEFPKTAQAQREALMGVTRQMEAVGDRDDKMTGSLDSLREAVTALGDATTASSVAVKNLQMTAIEDSERTADLLEAQNKRFTMLFTLTVTLTMLALIAGGVAWLRG